MARREFSRTVRAQALLRAQMCCEGILDSGERCNANLKLKPFEFDHNNPDGLTGEPTLGNCIVTCIPCHRAKTKRDVGAIAKAKRVEAKHLGITRPKSRPMPGTKASGFRKRMDGRVERRT